MVRIWAFRFTRRTNGAISSVQFRQMKVVSAAGVEPARAVCPGVIRKDAGDLFFVGSESVRPWTATRGEIRCVGKWQATLVLPQASGVLETLLHKLARGLSSLVEGTLS